MKQIAAILGFAALLGAAPLTQAQEITLKYITSCRRRPPHMPSSLRPGATRSTRESGGKLKMPDYTRDAAWRHAARNCTTRSRTASPTSWTLPGYTAGRFPLVEYSSCRS